MENIPIDVISIFNYERSKPIWIKFECEGCGRQFDMIMKNKQFVRAKYKVMDDNYMMLVQCAYCDCAFEYNINDFLWSSQDHYISI